MAKKSVRKPTRIGRDLQLQTLRPVPRLKLLDTRTEQRHIASLEDRRRFRPDLLSAPPVAVTRAATRLKVGRKLHSVKFAKPEQISLCAKRQRRKQVLFAKQIAGGKGLGRHKKRRTNQFSSVGCK